MTGLRRALWALAAAGLLFGLAVLALFLTNDTLEAPGAWAAAAVLTGWVFIATGLFAWRRADNRVGMLMAATGFAWLLAASGFSDLPLVFTVRQVFGAVFFAVVVPCCSRSRRAGSSRSPSAASWRRLPGHLGVLPLWLFADPSQLDCDDCPDNVLLVHANESLVRTLGTILNGIGVLLIAVVLVVLVRRWRRATAAQRRFLVPVYSAGVAVLFLLILLVALQAGGLNHDALDVIWVISMVPFALVPFLFLGTLVRARMIQSGAVGELMARLRETPRRGELRDALAEALGDPSLELVYWLPDDRRFVDARGHTVELPARGSGRSVTK